MADATAGGQRDAGAADGLSGSAPEAASPPEPSQPATESSRPALARRLTAPARWAGRLIVAHRWFAIVLALAVALRLVVMLAYPPILWFNDSYNYVADAVTKTPDIVRSNGYPLLLWVLLPFRSLTLIAALQALMGLAMGVGIYAVLRRRGLPWWGATLPALPVLFDVFELQLEHLVMSDVLFIFLITVALVALCWSDQPSLVTCLLVGLLIGYAALVRAVGEPLLIVVAVLLLVRRVNWKRAGAMLIVGLLPIFGYMAWYHSFYGQYGLDTSSGTFLYSRVSTFAECARMPRLPSDLKVLCDPKPPAQRSSSQQYLWDTTTPLYKLTRGNNFTEQANSLAGKFAKAAIFSQPGDYVAAVWDDTMHTFTWDRSVSDITGSGPSYRFRDTVDAMPWWANYYPEDKAALLKYGGPTEGQPKVVKPWSSIIQGYQNVFYLRGSMLAAILAIGLGGVVLRWRRWGGLALLPWAIAMVLVVLPDMTSGFSYRYVLAAVPVACLAAGLACTREPRRSRKAAAVAVAADASQPAPSADDEERASARS